MEKVELRGMPKERYSVKEKARGLEKAKMLPVAWVKALFVVLGWIWYRLLGLAEPSYCLKKPEKL